MLCARIFFSIFFCMKVVGIFFASLTSISTETHQHSRQSGSKVAREAAKVVKVEILAKGGDRKFHELNAADERS